MTLKIIKKRIASTTVPIPPKQKNTVNLNLSNSFLLFVSLSSIDANDCFVQMQGPIQNTNISL